MFERFTKSDISEMDGVSFVNGHMVRYKGYKQPEIFQSWSGKIFDSLLQAIFVHLNLRIRIDLPPIELFLGISLIKQSSSARFNYMRF